MIVIKANDTPIQVDIACTTPTTSTPKNTVFTYEIGAVDIGIGNGRVDEVVRESERKIVALLLGEMFLVWHHHEAGLTGSVIMIHSVFI